MCICCEVCVVVSTCEDGGALSVWHIVIVLVDQQHLVHPYPCTVVHRHLDGVDLREGRQQVAGPSNRDVVLACYHQTKGGGNHRVGMGEVKMGVLLG